MLSKPIRSPFQLGSFRRGPPRTMTTGAVVNVGPTPSAERKRITASTSTFHMLLEHRFTYVDKTFEIETMVSSDQKLLLCRPNRFGKSLTMSTLASLFRGHKYLFDGSLGFQRLAISESRWDWSAETHSVLHVNMQTVARRKGFRNCLLDSLTKLAEEHDVGQISQGSVKSATRDLVSGMARKSPSGKVVVLIDEVDAPVTDILHQLSLDEQQKVRASNQRTLRDFTSALEHLESEIRFQMYTGVTSMASLLIPGHITDLTFDEEIGSRLCGYTTKEIHSNFYEALMGLHHKFKVSVDDLNDKISEWYGGYSWGADSPEGGGRLHNPFAINTLMATQQFGPHWSTAMGPLFWLSDALADCNLDNVFRGRVPLQSRALASQWVSQQKETLDETMIRLMLLNHGLLTIDRVEVDPKTLVRIGSVTVPNKDVKEHALGPLLDTLYLGPVQ